MSDARFALVWFYARPDEWDAVDPYVKENELAVCGKVIRMDWEQGYISTWIKNES